MLQLYPPLLATQATVHALQSLLAGGDEVPSQKITPGPTQGSLSFLKYMTTRLSAGPAHPRRADQEKLRVIPSFNSSCGHAGAILVSVDAIPFQKLEQVPDLLCVLQKQLHVNELVCKFGELDARNATEQPAEPAGEDLDAQLQALIEGTADMRTLRVAISMLEEPGLGIKLSLQVFDGPHLAGRVVCELEATASHKATLKAQLVKVNSEVVELKQEEANIAEDPAALIQTLLQSAKTLT